MSEQEKLALLEDMMDMAEGSLEADLLLENIEEWDSMAMLSLIVMMDDEFEQVITAEQIRQLKTVRDILAFMHK